MPALECLGKARQVTETRSLGNLGEAQAFGIEHLDGAAAAGFGQQGSEGGAFIRAGTSDDSSGDRPRSGAAWPDPGGIPNHDGAGLLDGLVLYATVLYAIRLGANRLYDHANGRRASIGRHGQAAAQAACRPYWPGLAKGCRQPGPEPGQLRLQLRKQRLRPSSVLLMPSPLPRARTCLLYTSPSPRDGLLSRMPSSA